MRKIKLFFVLSALLPAFTGIYLSRQNTCSILLSLKNNNVASSVAGHLTTPQREPAKYLKSVSLALNSGNCKEIFSYHV